jgi:hypothetical protein
MKRFLDTSNFNIKGIRFYWILATYSLCSEKPNCDAPGFSLTSWTLMTGSAESNRPTLVKPRSTWVIISKTSPMNPNELLDQVYAHPWSTLGQRHGQNRLNPWRQRMSSGTFAAFSKIHLNTSKSIFMKVVHLVEGHNFHVEWHFKFWVEIGERLDRLPVPHVHRNRPAFKVGMTFL